ncbi:hypothetical protein DFA_00861 [Cavenderia fasciculata]|uniref:Ricin B lectin domain-containing protein n=1 Tax=Cavenderia fasciculata TaxID=261658 RepID=F4PU66_CACFS|nr:uncharacterized protein DFA_00861 [Cavenderia fasciculata]EGG20992.1 hypothetical protein DFA_00861 [Cavenderia fasciculata]|eukprot:XP_004358842.1 hypothetical protein DFA_00861 [Cavenderia fasciculata]
MKILITLFFATTFMVLLSCGLGITPGTYSYYHFPTTTPLETVEFQVTVHTDPGFFHKTFWSNQFYQSKGSVGYIGMQSNGGQKRRFQFSIWDGFNSTTTNPNARCGTFSEKGIGHSCSLQENWQWGHTFSFRLSVSNGWVTGTVVDLTDNVTYNIGSIKTNATGITSDLQSWVEYYEWNQNYSNCFNQPFSSASFMLPKGTAKGVNYEAILSYTKSSKNCTSNTITTVGNQITHRLSIGNSVRDHITPFKTFGDLCIDTASGKPEESSLIVSNCKPSQTSQQWVVSMDGTIRMRENFCFDIKGGDSSSAAPVISYPCHAQHNQLWSVLGKKIKSASGFCLTYLKKDQGLTVLPCNMTEGQEWNLPSSP